MTPASRSRARWGYALIVLSASAAASTSIAAALTFDAGLTPAEAGAVRVYGGTLTLGLIALLSLRLLRRADLPILIAFGVIALMLGPGAAFQAIGLMDVAIVMVIIFTAPVIVAAYERIRFAVRLPAYAYAAMVLAIAGVALMVLGGGGDGGGISPLGVAFSLVATCTYVLGVIMAERLPGHLPPMARTGFAMPFAAVAWAIFVPPWTLPFDRFGDVVAFEGRLDLAVPVWAALLVVALVGSIVVYLTWVTGTVRVGPGAASMVGSVEPVVAGALAWLILAQRLTPVQVLGMAVAIGAIIVVERARLHRRASTVPDAPVDLL